MKREPRSIRINPEIMKKFRRICDKHGFIIGVRIEIAMKRDMAYIKKMYKDDSSEMKG